MGIPLPYCGSPPSPAELLARFNLDPYLISVLLALTLLQMFVAPDRKARMQALAGWVIAAAAFTSPLCALSVSLFSARILQHMILLLAAAPLIAASARPSPRTLRMSVSVASTAFFVSLWVWHMPTPYDATFTSKALYWAMHVTLFGSGILLWHALLQHARSRTGAALLAGMLTSIQMGLLGAVLSFANRPLFVPHYTTTQVWGLTPLQDQQLGGTLMWVPGILLFAWITLRSLRLVLKPGDDPKHA
jgi:putative membrane protein